MKPTSIIQRLVILLITLMSAIGANAQEAYACYTESNTTLTFYYDNLRSTHTRTGTTYDLNTGDNPGWYTDGTNANVTKVVFDPSFVNARPSTTRGWFLRMYELESITGMNYLNTSEVTNMNYMFMGCTKLTNLDVSHFDTSNVTDMIQMFNGCYSLTSLDLSSFNTSKVTDMLWMFHGCINLQTIYVGSGWTTNVLMISSEMFYDCTKLVGGQGTTYDANYVDGSYAHIDGGPSNPGYLTEKPKEAYACYTSSNTTLTFYYDNLRNTRPGTTYNLNRVGDAPSWVNDGNNAYVTKVVFDPLFADARPTSTYGWFHQMENLQTIEGLSYLNTSEVTDMTYMFGYCKKLTSLDLSNFNTSKVSDMKYMFYSCLNLQTIIVGNSWSTAAVTSSSNMFMGCRVLVGGQGTAYDVNHVNKTYAHIDGGPSNPGYLTGKPKEAYACYTESNTTLTFYYDNLRSTRTGTTYDLNTGDDDPGWFTDGTRSKVTKVEFDPSFADARPTTTNSWFCSMMGLQSIEGMNYLNTSEVTNMNYMFMGCTKLTSLDVSHFDTSKVTDMTQMFNGCYSLTSLDLSSFNTSKVTYMYRMFHSCINLQTIYVGSGWTTNVVMTSSDMFYDCTSLVGGKGTAYDVNHVNKTYAHIDGGPSNPGYFTAEGTEAYACYTPGDMTLTFYYDNLRDSRTGTTYGLNTGARPEWLINGTNANVTKVVFDTSFAGARPTTTGNWFNGMRKLIIIEGMNYLNTNEVTNMFGMFVNCEQLTKLDLSSFNTSKVSNMNLLFSGCKKLRTIYVGNGWTTEQMFNNFDNMFSNCNSLVGGKGTIYNDSNPKDKTYAHIDEGPSNPGYFTAEGTEAYACYTPGNMTLTFYYDNLRSSREGTTYDLNTGNNRPDWYVDGPNQNVIYVVFDPSFAGARPTSTYEWFDRMYLLEFITGMNYLNTSEVTDMSSMFYSCSKLTSLDVSNFNTSKVTDMYCMFRGCVDLTSLDLSSFNTSNVTNMNRMFDVCRNLQTIYVGEGWSTAAVTSSTDMFYDCTSLVGGKGTTYNAEHVDGSYARIDGGTDNSGYLTDGSARQAYAVYAEENTMLTFYYDTQRTSREGTTYDLNTDSNLPSWFTDRNYSSVTKVLFDPSFASARPTSTFYWFMGMASLQSIEGMRYLNTSEVTNMSYMFTGCQLTNLDLRIFNTAKVTDMSGMFDSSKLVTLNLSSFNTSEVTSMTAMFRDCNKLKTIFVGDEWNTNQVTSSNLMFQNCTSLVGGQGTEYKPTYPTDKTYARMDGGMSHLGYFSDFIEAYACYNPEKTTLTFYYDKLRSSRGGMTYELNTDNNKPDWYTDGAYANVTKVVFAPSFAGVRPTSTSYWFYDMENLETIEGISYLNTSEVTNMERMFFYCKGLKSLDLSSFNTSKVTNMSQMFYACVFLRTVYVNSGWSTSALTESYFTMFDYCYSLVGGNGTTFDANHINAAYAHIDGEGGAGYFTAAGAQPWTSLAYACYNDGTLTFYYDGLRSSREGTTYDLNTSKAAPDWFKDGNYAYVTKVIFDPSFADARPTSTHVWFYYMTNLQTIEGLSYLNTSEVAYMSLMFSTCTKLTSLDLSSFDTSKLIEMNEMFFDCFDLTNLNLSSFNTSKVTNMEYMFMHCNNLRTIYVGEGWNTDAVKKSTQMFYDCPKLVGGQGTTYDANHVDKTYAHIDGGSSNPGYFTARTTGIATDLHQVTSDKSQVTSDEWYTIDGRKLNGMPAKKGVYIQNGQKRIIK